MAFVQPFLQNNTEILSHLQFAFKEKMDNKEFFKALSKVWEANILGKEDTTLNKNHEYGALFGSVVVGFKPEFWKSVTQASVPDNLNSYTEDIVGINGMISPAKQEDLWIWINQTDKSALFDSLNKIKTLLEPFCILKSEQTCFTYHNSITFDGFADGVGNPNSFDAYDATIIPDNKDGAGGTTLLLQKWTMKIDEMRALSPEEGSQVYGRNKAGSHKLSPLPERSHVARNQFYDENGKTVDIVRRNAYFGDINEAGVMFLGFSNNIDVTMGMLKQMFGVGPDKIKKTDKILDFSTAISSAIYFVPSIDDMRAVGIQPKDQE